MQVCFGAGAMLVFDGFACLEEASGLFPAQDWGVFWAGSGEKEQHCSCISTALCALWALPLATKVHRVQFLSSPYCCDAVVFVFMSKGTFFIEMEQKFLVVLMTFSFLKCLSLYVEHLQHLDNHCSSSAEE